MPEARIIFSSKHQESLIQEQQCVSQFFLGQLAETARIDIGQAQDSEKMQ